MAIRAGLLFYAPIMHPLANIAVAAARAAGNVMMRHLRQGRPLDVEIKGRNDFVTHVDREAEAAVIDTIRRAHPDHAILAEESGRTQGRRSDVEWIVDPIDGTTNYIRHIPHFAVSIAASVRGQVEHGIIYDPFKEELFAASRGRGASLDNRRIRVSKTTHFDMALLATGFAYQRHHGIDEHFEVFRTVLESCGDVRRGGSAALDLAYVAAGRLDGYWEANLKPWDTAAGLLLVREAGGVASDFGDGDPQATGSVIAGTPKVQARLREIVRRATA